MHFHILDISAYIFQYIKSSSSLCIIQRIVISSCIIQYIFKCILNDWQLIYRNIYFLGVRDQNGTRWTIPLIREKVGFIIVVWQSSREIGYASGLWNMFTLQVKYSTASFTWTSHLIQCLYPIIMVFRNVSLWFYSKSAWNPFCFRNGRKSGRRLDFNGINWIL